MVSNLPTKWEIYKRRRYGPWVGKMPWRRKWQPPPVFLPGKIPRIEVPSRLQSIGSQRVGHDGSNLAQHVQRGQPLKFR